jgi:hypothetical protein
MHPLTKLQADLEHHISDETEKWDTLMRQNEDQTRAITELTRAVNELTAATEGIVESWRTLQAIRRFTVWLSGFAVIGGIVAACKKWGLI